jgi:arsenate reductase
MMGMMRVRLKTIRNTVHEKSLIVLKKKVLFICTHNSARSQIAEAYLNNQYGEAYEAYSAGKEPTNVNPYVVRVMADTGVNLSKARSKSIEEFRGEVFDYVVTVCDHVREVCPFFPGEVILHKSFRDPSTFKGSEEEILEEIRKLRDNIKKMVDGNIRTLKYTLFAARINVI